MENFFILLKFIVWDFVDERCLISDCLKSLVLVLVNRNFWNYRGEM